MKSQAKFTRFKLPEINPKMEPVIYPKKTINFSPDKAQHYVYILHKIGDSLKYDTNCVIETNQDTNPQTQISYILN